MRRQTSLLVSLVPLVDRLPWPPAPPQRPRGRPKTYADRLIVKAFVLMIIRRLDTAYALLAFLDQDDSLPQTVPGLIGCVGRHLVGVLHPWACHGRAAAVDSTP